ncbi:MAG: RluA family pseudouridine synthase [Puniceicoccales bacterium]|nr:RluA family pseudouridine synthase [Puniceicoccales bacterium]
MRLDVALARSFEEKSRTQIQRACREGLIHCNGIPIGAKAKVCAGQTLTIQWLSQGEMALQPRQMDLEILYEDEHMLAINKPSGEVVHPAPHVAQSIVEAVLHHCNGQLAMAAGKHRPGVVHRLDKGTSGVLLFAKTDIAYHRLSGMFGRRDVEKYYEALAHGNPKEKEGTILLPIGRDLHWRTRMAIRENGRPAHTHWQCQRRYSNGVILLSLRIYTGRTHQIRVHLASMRCPILGDSTYGFLSEWLPNLHIPRTMLHSHRIALEHPMTHGPLLIEAPRPRDMEMLIRLFAETPKLPETTAGTPYN